MPQGKGTYGNQVGRPSKNKTMANGDPKKKAAAQNVGAKGRAKARATGLKSSSLEEHAAREKAKGLGKVDMVKNVAKNPYPKTKDSMIDKARKASDTNTSGPAPQRGPRSEGKRGKGTGWAN